jgi:chromosome partitioning protein
MSYIIAVSNDKGGVAKTTTTFSLGAALAGKGHAVLLMDLDPQAHLTLSLGIEPGSAAVTSGHVLMESAPLMSGRLGTELDNLDIIPANAGIESAEQFLPLRAHYTSGLRRALEAAAPLPYEFVLFDCPPFLGAITTNALSAADLLVIPTQPEYFSAYGLRNMMGIVRRVRQDSNPNLGYRILITLLDRRNRAHRNIQEQLHDTFGKGLFKTVIEIDTKLRESAGGGLPIIRYRRGARGSRQYRELAQELIAYLKETSQQAA